MSLVDYEAKIERRGNKFILVDNKQYRSPLVSTDIDSAIRESLRVLELRKINDNRINYLENNNAFSNG